MYNIIWKKIFALNTFFLPNIKIAPDIKLQQISKFSVFTIFTDFIPIDPEK